MKKIDAMARAYSDRYGVGADLVTITSMETLNHRLNIQTEKNELLEGKLALVQLKCEQYEREIKEHRDTEHKQIWSN